MNLIAHRGYKTDYIKENTIPAFKNALNNEFIGIELDVRTTKDGKLVVCHDALIDRVSNGNGFIRNKTYKELLKYNFGSKKIKCKIPLLINVLKMFKCIKIIELKERIDFNKIISLIDDNTYFISFNTNYILELKKRYPKYKFGILSYGLNSNLEYNLDIICILDILADKNTIMNYVNKGIKVFIYGIGKKVNYVTDDKMVYYIVDKKIDLI